MKVLILAAGYATRLYPLTKNRPKPLLPVNGKPIIDYIIEKLPGVGPQEIYVVTNRKFVPQFRDWARGKDRIRLINDGTYSEENRLGAIADINFAIDKKGIDDDILVIGGDNLFDFSLSGFLSFAKLRSPSVSIGFYDVRKKRLAKRFGVVEIDDKSRLIGFEEKPAKPRTSLVSVCIYFFPSSKFGLFKKYLKGGNSADAPGHYINWLRKREAVFGYKLEGVWFDIGTKEAYEEAGEELKNAARKNKNIRRRKG